MGKHKVDPHFPVAVCFTHLYAYQMYRTCRGIWRSHKIFEEWFPLRLKSLVIWTVTQENSRSGVSCDTELKIYPVGERCVVLIRQRATALYGMIYMGTYGTRSHWISDSPQSGIRWVSGTGGEPGETLSFKVLCWVRACASCSITSLNSP